MKKQEAQQVLQQVLNTATKTGLFGDTASVIKAQEALDLLSYELSKGSMDEWKKEIDLMGTEQLKVKQ